jgi:hypothetical protein
MTFFFFLAAPPSPFSLPRLWVVWRCVWSSFNRFCAAFNSFCLLSSFVVRLSELAIWFRSSLAAVADGEAPLLRVDSRLAFRASFFSRLDSFGFPGFSSLSLRAFVGGWENGDGERTSVLRNPQKGRSNLSLLRREISNSSVHSVKNGVQCGMLVGFALKVVCAFLEAFHATLVALGEYGG